MCQAGTHLILRHRKLKIREKRRKEKEEGKEKKSRDQLEKSEWQILIVGSKVKERGRNYNVIAELGHVLNVSFAQATDRSSRKWAIGGGGDGTLSRAHRADCFTLNSTPLLDSTDFSSSAFSDSLNLLRWTISSKELSFFNVPWVFQWFDLRSLDPDLSIPEILRLISLFILVG